MRRNQEKQLGILAETLISPAFVRTMLKTDLIMLSTLFVLWNWC